MSGGSSSIPILIGEGSRVRVKTGQHEMRGQKLGCANVSPPLDVKTDRELLALYSDVMEALRTRGVVRSSNSPAADYAERLAARALRLTLNAGSTAGFDGLNPVGERIEVKCRRLTPQNGSRQLSAIRGLDQAHFDYLAGILFAPDFTVVKGALVPYAVVKEQAVYVKHTNSWRFMLRDRIWALPGVQDITRELREAQA